MALTRSENMSRIRSFDTRPEIRLRRALWSNGFRYRLNCQIEGIRPDMVFIKPKVAVFVDGCQWHGCPEHYVRARTKTEFWQNKLLINVERDTKQTQKLQKAGWYVYRVWEHEVWEKLPQIVANIKALIEKTGKFQEENWRVFQVDVIDVDTDLERRHMRLLHSPDKICIVERVRSTRKWSRTNS